VTPTPAPNFETGPTEELSLRVSVAVLVRILLNDPETNDQLLVLERKATFDSIEEQVSVIAQPFGGGLRINNPDALHELTNGFRYDSESSRIHQDFRIMIQPSRWDAVKAFCLEQFRNRSSEIIELSPERELAEEFGFALKIGLKPDQYHLRPLWTMIENNPVSSGNIYASGTSTVRLYQVFEATIVDEMLQSAILKNSRSYSDYSLRAAVLDDVRLGGKGWANAFLTIPLENLRNFYHSIAPKDRDFPVTFSGSLLESNIPALLDDVAVLKFQRIDH